MTLVSKGDSGALPVCPIPSGSPATKVQAGHAVPAAGARQQLSCFHGINGSTSPIYFKQAG